MLYAPAEKKYVCAVCCTQVSSRFELNDKNRDRERERAKFTGIASRRQKVVDEYIYGVRERVVLKIEVKPSGGNNRKISSEIAFPCNDPSAQTHTH